MPYGSVTGEGLFKLADINMEKRRMAEAQKTTDFNQGLALRQDARLQTTFDQQQAQARENLQLLNNKKEIEGTLAKAMAGTKPGLAFNAGWDSLNSLASDPKFAPLVQKTREELLGHQMELLNEFDKRDPSKKLSTQVYNETVGAVIGHQIDSTSETPEGTIVHGWFKNPDNTWVEKSLLTPKGGGQPIDVTDRYGLGSNPADKNKETWHETNVMRNGKPVIVERSNLGNERFVSSGLPAKASANITIGGVNAGQPLTYGQKAVDRAFAKTYEEFAASGGYADVVKQMAQLEEVQGKLESGKSNLTGPVIGSTPDMVLKVTNPEAIDTRDLVQEVVQRNLRAVLGAQFTEREGTMLINRAYNPNLSEKENAVRVGRLVTQIKAAAATKQDAVDYWDENGTLAGWKGKMPKFDDFMSAVAKPTTTQNPTSSIKVGKYTVEAE